MKKELFIGAIIAVLFCCTTFVQADSVPQLINYQGKLTDASGKPLDGPESIEFNIYDAASGGSVVWGPQTFDNVTLTNGQFNVILGPADAASRSIADSFTSNNRYIGVKVDGSEITPRQQILSTPYAIISGNGLPPGTIIAHASSDAPPGFLACTGSYVSKDDYPELFKTIGYHYGGSGDSFKLPDLRGRAPIGYGEGSGLTNRSFGSTGGLERVSLTVPEMPSHRHSVTATVGNTCAGDGTAYDAHWRCNSYTSNYTKYEGGSQSHENMPPYIALNYIIKY